MATLTVWQQGEFVRDGYEIVTFAEYERRQKFMEQTRADMASRDETARVAAVARECAECEAMLAVARVLPGVAPIAFPYQPRGLKTARAPKRK